MRNVYIICMLFFLLQHTVLAQLVCQTGAIGVTGPNCGCLAGCDLSGFGGPNCGPVGVTGSCSAGYQYMSITVNIPAGCTILGEGTMQNWPGCSASGGDGGSTCGLACTGSCDKLRVVSTSNPIKNYLCGASNATLYDTETQTGPGTITVEGYANRADEIIVYNFSYVSGGFLCGPSCGALNTNSLLSFKIWSSLEDVFFAWNFSVVKNTSFHIECSDDGIHYFPLRYVSGNIGISEYTTSVNRIYTGTHYFRLKITDEESSIYFYSAVIALGSAFFLEEIRISPNPVRSGGEVLIEFPIIYGESELFIFSADNKIMLNKHYLREKNSPMEEIISFPTPGLYIVTLKTGNSLLRKKIVVY